MSNIPNETLIADNYHDIYLRNLVRHKNQFMFENSPRGLRQKERLFTTFSLTNPIERVCYSAERRINIVFHLAEVLWYLNGDNSLDFIAYYCPRMRRYSTNNKTMSGSAYGPKIFSWSGHINQWQWVCNELLQDPDSRRAVIHIRGPEEMLVSNNIDATCTLSLQFLNRENHLNLIVCMRSNDIFRGGCSDIFSFTFLQELMANELGLKLGVYHHHVGSSHFYETDTSFLDKVLAHMEPRSAYPWSFPAMPNGNNWPAIQMVLEYEKHLRQNKTQLDINAISDIQVSDYWRQIVALLEVYRQVHYENKICLEHIEYLWPLYQYFLENRFKCYYT